MERDRTETTERTRDERRRRNYYIVRRKKRIVDAVRGGNWSKFDGQYRKGKVHCSCPCCTEKTKGKTEMYANGTGKDGYNWTHSDRLKVDSMDYQWEEYQNAD